MTSLPFKSKTGLHGVKSVDFSAADSALYFIQISRLSKSSIASATVSDFITESKAIGLNLIGDFGLIVTRHFSNRIIFSIMKQLLPIFSKILFETSYE